MDNKSETLVKASKTRLKKEAMALQELGRDLTSFTTSDLDRLQLSPNLRKAIDDFKRLPNAHGAKKRQLQYIGRLIRENEGKTLQTQIRLFNSSSNQTEKRNSANKIFERVISEGDPAITDIVAKQQKFERQKLRQLRSNIVKARAEKRTSAENRLRTYIKLVIDS